MKQRTFALLKPDTIAKGLQQEIEKRIEELGLVIVRRKIICATKNQCMDHYDKDDEWCIRQGQRKLNQGASADKSALQHGRRILELMANYFMSGEMVALIVEGENAVELMRKLVGDTEPINAASGTLRGEYSADSYELANHQERALHNIVHTSDSEEEAKRETNIWFPEAILN